MKGLEDCPRYPTIEAFYSANETRRHSGEADYGCHWQLDGFRGRWRVSYVRSTGEIYAVYQMGKAGPVFVLGKVPPDEEERAVGYRWDVTYYRTLDTILDGWADRCTGANSLCWVRDQLRN